ncbi:hypothetical protein IFT47_20530 [Pseudomonas sp. CFBP 13711]|uniref:hypothetical protein n=1 Tax=unclassified Pseudomonas TaxID=196821 RepID=UPI00177D6525|nr:MULTISPECIES: hypothetical protein [unclassified Pseudomonas]MBD8709021.1 hypothetical protein [Pseudomonas sp. CFBP 13711]MBD8714057.1 hypothetical protein [Pseudomonas sp. CFBP 13715]
MIDHTDKQTQQINFEAKRGRGRPKTGTAMTPAEKQRAYRERNKGNVTDRSGEIEALKKEIEELKIALGKEVVARKKAEEKILLVTEKGEEEQGKKYWLQQRQKGERKWVYVNKECGFTEQKIANACMKHLEECTTVEGQSAWEFRVVKG